MHIIHDINLSRCRACDWKRRQQKVRTDFKPPRPCQESGSWYGIQPVKAVMQGLKSSLSRSFIIFCNYALYLIYGTALGSPTPPPGDGHGSLPRPLWEWVGWLWMGGNAG